MSPAGASKNQNSAGFTLVEVLTVLFILALVTGAVVMTLPSKPPAALTQARALTTDLNVAADDALLAGRPAALSLTPEGYQIYSYSEFDWQQQKSVPWADGTSPQLRRDGERVALPDTPTPLIIFEPIGQSETFEITLQTTSADYVLRNAGNGQTLFELDQ